MTGGPSPVPPSASRATSRVQLTEVAYASADLLAARQAIYQFRTQPIDFAAWALGQLDWRGGERVLDIGCGNGLYLQRLASRTPPPSLLLGADLSPGMLADSRRHWPVTSPRPQPVVADITRLPIPDASLDVVLAMHMLYHVPDVPQAVHELRRVLRPGGTLLAATNSEEHMQGIAATIRAALRRLGADLPPQPSPARHFSLERGGALLGAAFGSVERLDRADPIVVPSVEPVVRYIASLDSLRDYELPAGLDWSAVVTAAEPVVRAEIAAHGAYRVTAHAGLFRCR